VSLENAQVLKLHESTGQPAVSPLEQSWCCCYFGHAHAFASAVLGTPSVSTTGLLRAELPDNTRRAYS